MVFCAACSHRIHFVSLVRNERMTREISTWFFPHWMSIMTQLPQRNCTVWHRVTMFCRLTRRINRIFGIRTTACVRNKSLLSMRKQTVSEQVGPFFFDEETAIKYRKKIHSRQSDSCSQLSSSAFRRRQINFQQIKRAALVEISNKKLFFFHWC